MQGQMEFDTLKTLQLSVHEFGHKKLTLIHSYSPRPIYLHKQRFLDAHNRTEVQFGRAPKTYQNRQAPISPNYLCSISLKSLIS